VKAVKYDDIVIGHWADYYAHVWGNDGKDYDLLNVDDRTAALSSTDEFVRMMAREYADKSDTCSCWPCVILNREFHKTSALRKWWRKLCTRLKQ
jgi:hypothetical protein